MKNSIFFFFVLVVALYACEDKKANQKEYESAPIPEIISRDITESYLDCSPDTSNCTYASISIAQFTDTSKTALNHAILNLTMGNAKNYLNEGSNAFSLEAVAISFIDDYAAFVKDFPDYRLGWYLQISADIIYNTEKFVTVKVDDGSFTGGAHPNHTSSYYVLDGINDRILNISDIVSDTIQFKHALESAFRIQNGIKEEQTLADAGYWIEDGDFYLNDNIGITEDKIIVHFNPYEIAPYSMGPTTIELDKNSVAQFLKIE